MQVSGAWYLETKYWRPMLAKGPGTKCEQTSVNEIAKNAKMTVNEIASHTSTTVSEIAANAPMSVSVA